MMLLWEEKNESQAKGIMKRADVPEEQRWDLSDLYATEEAWEADMRRLEAMLKEDTGEGMLLESGAKLYASFTRMLDLLHLAENVYVYTHLKVDEDLGNSRSQAMKERAQDLYSRAAARYAFLEPELLSVTDEKFWKIFAEDARLEQYRHHFEKLRERKAHVLTDREEELLAKLEPTLSASSQTFGLLNNADLRFDPVQDGEGQSHEMSHARYGRYVESKDRVLREAAFKSMYKSFDQFKNTFASTLSATVKRHNTLAEIRGFATAREAALFANDIPEQVYDQLLETVESHLDLLHRFMEKRKELLGVDELHCYDLRCPLTQAEMEVPYEEAQQIILEALKPLGANYAEGLKKAFSEGWIDRAENAGKRSGAYSSGCYDSKPYILMTYQGTLDNLYTLIHELGHSMHSYMTRTAQPYIYGDYGIFLAEIASTTNENLLTRYLMDRETDPERKRHLLINYLTDFMGTVFRQTQFARFELEMHRRAQAGEALTAESLTELYAEINKKYYGPALSQDEEIGLEWARIPHFYYNFYVYQYATGFSAATAFAKRILEGEEGAVERYLGYLSAGSSADPLEVLDRAGLDMRSSKPIEAALDVFRSYLEELERL